MNNVEEARESKMEDAKFCDLGPEHPNEEQFAKSKAILQAIHSGGHRHHNSLASDSTTSSLYEHMVSLMKYILEHQPSHGLDQFEALSLLIKRERGAGTSMAAGLVEADLHATAPEKDDQSPELAVATAERTLLKHPMHVWDHPPTLGEPLLPEFSGNLEDDERMQVLPNLQANTFLIEQASIGMDREDLLRVWLAMRHLVPKLPSVTSLNFWGKVFGVKANYYILEATFEGASEPDPEILGLWDKWREPRKAKPQPKIENSESFQAELLDENQSKVGADLEMRLLMKLPKNKWKPPAPYPLEIRGRGMNRWDYYVCTALSESNWVRLPPIKPIHISMARQSTRLFTGDLNAEVGWLPGGVGKFPGVEAHYLRAQIARISATCMISPAGIYELDEEAQVEEGEAPESLTLAEEYEAPEFSEMLDLANWVHHRPYLFSQGRVNWMSQRQAAKALSGAGLSDEEDNVEARLPIEEAEEMAEEEAGDELEEPEEAPDILTQVEEDAPLKPLGDVGLATNPKPGSPGDFLAPAWRIRASTLLLPVVCAVAVVSSNRWPGAHALAREKNFTNVYIGWGQKYLSSAYSPIRHGNLMVEFNEEATPLVETVDPTPLEEEAVRAAKEARRLVAEAREEVEEENEEEEDDIEE